MLRMKSLIFKNSKIFIILLCCNFPLLVFGEIYDANLGRGVSCSTDSDGCRQNLAIYSSCNEPNAILDKKSFIRNGKSRTTHQCFSCEDGDIYISYGKCLKEKRCSEGLIYNSITGQCEDECPYPADSSGKCNPPPEENNCEAQGKNPIDYSSGNKLRREHVITVGTRQPLALMYYYNNNNNYEKTAAGIVSNKSAPSTVIATSAPIASSVYATQYNEKGLLKSTVLANQYYGSLEQYWRHSFDDVLQIHGNVYQLHLANGQLRTFNGLGVSDTHPTHALLALANGAESYSGYKWVDRKNGQEKYFDSVGRLRKVIFSARGAINLSYTNNNLTEIKNTHGETLKFEYTDFDTYSVYAKKQLQHVYPTKIIGSDGKVVELEWKSSFRGKTATFYMLTRISRAVAGIPNTARDFKYTDTRWPASITEILTVTDIKQDVKKLYAEFKYDTQGRTIYSGLAGGVEAESIAYSNDLNRTVTNALGKDATYTFAFIEGVKKLKKVVGEPTSSCLRSEVEYLYNNDGTKLEKHQNSKVTRYTQYDSKKRELQRVEAYGTADARTITTQWHPILNLKTKVIKPKTTTEWEYFADGKLKATKTYATAH